MYAYIATTDNKYYDKARITNEARLIIINNAYMIARFGRQYVW